MKYPTSLGILSYLSVSIEVIMNATEKKDVYKKKNSMKGISSTIVIPIIFTRNPNSSDSLTNERPFENA